LKNEATVYRLILFLLAFFLIQRIYSEENNDSDTLIEIKTNTFFDSLETKASGKRWTRELFDIIVVPSRLKKSQPRKIKAYTPNYEKYEGKLIRKINIEKIDVFGPEVYDTSLKAENFFEITANKLHIKTNDKIIRKNILLKPGYFLNSVEVEDNERVLRRLPSINDARIIVTNYDSLNNTVDLTVRVKDVWSKGFGLETQDFSDGRFDIWDRNIFGTGHQFTNIFVWDNAINESMGYEGIYNIKNIYGSFIDSELRYISIFDRQEYQINIKREFFTPESKYAGGLQYRNSQYDEYVKNKIVKDTFNLDYEFTKMFISRSFPLMRKKSTEYRTNIITSLAYLKYDYFDGPYVSEVSLYEYQSRAMVLGELSYSRHNFYKTNYIYSFGRTEDIPLGLLTSIKMGYEKNKFKSRIYSQLSISSGYYYPQAGYLYNSFDLSFFTKIHGLKEQGAIKYTFDYFTELFTIGRFRFRQFVKLNYVSGFNRYEDEYVSLNKGNGIRGFSTDSLYYNKKMVINFESVLFTPLYFYGFRYVFYGFFDIGFTGPSGKKIITNKPYTGFGLGLRIRNDRLVFRTIQIQFGVYPGAPDDVDLLKTGISGEPRLRPKNFYVKEPKIFTYK